MTKLKAKAGSIISVVGKSTLEMIEPFFMQTKSPIPIGLLMNSVQTHIRKCHPKYLKHNTDYADD